MLRYEADAGRATITIDDPDRHNPLSNATMRELTTAVERAVADASVRVIIVTGAGNRAFSAGGDLSGGFVDAPLDDHAARGALADLFRALRHSPKPVIARVNGHALGAGFGLAAACDVVVVANTATLGAPEIRIGLWPMMITAVLRQLVSQRALLDLMLTGRRLSAEEALALGVVSRVVEPAELDGAIDEVVEQLLATSPAVLALGKRAFYASADLDFDSALDHLHTGLTAVSMTADAAEGVAAFTEKRQPEWRGR